MQSSSYRDVNPVALSWTPLAPHGRGRRHVAEQCRSSATGWCKSASGPQPPTPCTVLSSRIGGPRQMPVGVISPWDTDDPRSPTCCAQPELPARRGCVSQGLRARVLPWGRRWWLGGSGTLAPLPVPPGGDRILKSSHSRDLDDFTGLQFAVIPLIGLPVNPCVQPACKLLLVFRLSH